jgi:hypothetical protein
MNVAGLVNNTENFSLRYRFLMSCEDYFRWGDRKIRPILGVHAGQEIIGPEDVFIQSNLIIDAIKIVSCIIIIFPILAGIAVGIHRRYYKIHDISALIKNTPDQKEISEATTGDANRIVSGLYLGNGFSLVDSAGFEKIYMHNNGVKVGVRDTNNPHQFRGIITVCPLADLGDRVEDFYFHVSDLTIDIGMKIHQKEEMMQKKLAGRGIEWLYAGRAISDISRKKFGLPSETEESRKKKWASFTHDLTYPTSALAAFEPLGREKQDYYGILQAKETIMEKVNPADLFATPFHLMDRAVLWGEKILVHCSEGKSRSTALIIAYLVNRFKVTTDEAIKFVKSKRPCINPKFAPELRQYEASLLRK